MLCKILLLSCFFLLACSKLTVQNNPERDDIEIGHDIPGWVTEVERECSQLNELCASAEGSSMDEADTRAKRNLAAIFKTNIISSLSLNQFSSQSGAEASLIETTQTQLQEQVEQELETVSIKKRFMKNDLYFSLASLDKRAFAASLASKINELDQQIDSMYKLSRRSMYLPLKNLVTLRNDLNNKYEFLTNQSIPGPIGLNQVEKLKFSKANNSKYFFLQANSEREQDVSKYLASYLTRIGHYVVNANDPKLDETIVINTQASEQYFNVPGFKKLLFTISITRKDRQGRKLGELTLSEASSGRSTTQAYSKIRNVLHKTLEERLSELNID
jgi:hypothetical protein